MAVLLSLMIANQSAQIAREMMMADQEINDNPPESVPSDVEEPEHEGGRLHEHLGDSDPGDEAPDPYLGETEEDRPDDLI
jgi:hypothetical protein